MIIKACLVASVTSYLWFGNQSYGSRWECTFGLDMIWRLGIERQGAWFTWGASYEDHIWFLEIKVTKEKCIIWTIQVRISNFNQDPRVV